MTLRIAVTALIASAVLTTPAIAQSGSRGTMVMDDGTQRHVLHYSEPDVEFFTQPEFSMRDGILFTEELSLSEPQSLAVARLIEQYFEKFEQLLKEKHPEPAAAMSDEPRRMRRPGAGDDDGDDGAEADQQSDGDARADPIRDIILEELGKVGIEAASFDDLPVSPSISIGVSLSDDGSGAPPEPTVDVGLSFGGNDDTISEEMRAKLQKAADAAVPRITEHVKSRESDMVRISPPGASTPEEEIAKRWTELESLRERVDEFVKARQRLRNQLLAEVQAILAEEQHAIWPRFERTLRRVKTMPWAEFVGEGVDLIAIFEEQGHLADENVETLLDLYALRLDEALKRRNGLLQTADAEIDRALYDGEYDDAVRVGRRFSDSRERICDLNREFAQLLLAELDDASAAVMREAIEESANPRVYRPTIGERAFSQAMELDSLTDDQRTAIKHLSDVYTQQLRQINDKVDRTLREQQSERLVQSLERVVGMIRGEEDEQTMLANQEDVADAFRDRRNLDVRMMRSLYAVLQPAQVAKLPQIPVTDIAEPVRADHTEHGGEFIDE